jgi:hypothetical protein
VYGIEGTAENSYHTRREKIKEEREKLSVQE